MVHIAESFRGQLAIYKVQISSDGRPAAVELVQHLPCAGVQAVDILSEADGTLWLATATSRESWAPAASPIFKFDSTSGRFVLNQTVSHRKSNCQLMLRSQPVPVSN